MLLKVDVSSRLCLLTSRVRKLEQRVAVPSRSAPECQELSRTPRAGKRTCAHAHPEASQLRHCYTLLRYQSVTLSRALPLFTYTGTQGSPEQFRTLSSSARLRVDPGTDPATTFFRPTQKTTKRSRVRTGNQTQGSLVVLPRKCLTPSLRGNRPEVTKDLREVRQWCK